MPIARFREILRESTAVAAIFQKQARIIAKASRRDDRNACKNYKGLQTVPLAGIIKSTNAGSVLLPRCRLPGQSPNLFQFREHFRIELL